MKGSGRREGMGNGFRAMEERNSRNGRMGGKRSSSGDRLESKAFHYYENRLRERERERVERCMKDKDRMK